MARNKIVTPLVQGILKLLPLHVRSARVDQDYKRTLALCQGFDRHTMTPMFVDLAGSVATRPHLDYRHCEVTTGTEAQSGANRTITPGVPHHLFTLLSRGEVGVVRFTDDGGTLRGFIPPSVGSVLGVGSRNLQVFNVWGGFSSYQWLFLEGTLPLTMHWQALRFTSD